LILDHFQYFRYCPAAQIGLKSLRRCQNHNFRPSIVPENLAPGRDVGASRRRPDESQKAVLAHWPWRRSGDPDMSGWRTKGEYGTLTSWPSEHARSAVVISLEPTIPSRSPPSRCTKRSRAPCRFCIRTPGLTRSAKALRS